MNLPLNSNGLTVVVLAVLLLSAVITDIRTHRISNAMVVAVLLIGLISQLGNFGYTGIIYWLGGAAVGLLFFLPFYMGGGMGAGDVKLLAAVGSTVGPLAALFTGGITLLAGVPLALFMLFKSKYALRDKPSAGIKASNCDVRFQSDDGPAHATVGPLQRVPYAAAIAIGAIGGFWQAGKLNEFIEAII